MNERLENLTARLDAYEQSAEFVLGKVRSTMQLVSNKTSHFSGFRKDLKENSMFTKIKISDTINLKSQHTTETMSSVMLELSKSSTEDSTAMRVITLVTLVYLPSSFLTVSRVLAFLPSYISFSIHTDFFKREQINDLIWTSSPSPPPPHTDIIAEGGILTGQFCLRRASLAWASFLRV